jgi:sugar lactone lactonase YvrE
MARSRSRAAAGILLLSGSALLAQTGIAPVNDRPNPYRTLGSWPTLPAGRTIGATGAVAIDRDGKSVWIVDRCGGTTCGDSTVAPVMKFDADGKLVRSFGSGLFLVPHGIDVDRDGNVWVTDASDGMDTPSNKGHQVFKFSPDGKLLLTLGKPGVAGAGMDTFNRPSDVLVAPNGDIFVADGHGGNSNDRIVKFSGDGRFLMAWGHRGTAPGEFNTPHGITMDSQGRLFVADLWNYRIQIFDQNGKFIDQWMQFGQPGGVYIDRNDVLYVADSLSGPAARKEWVRGIRIGSARTGMVTGFIPDPTPDVVPITAAEGVAADAAGNIYTAVVMAPAVHKYVK